MKWHSFKRIIKLGIINFWRNSWLSITATFIMTFTLIIISIFASLTIVINKTTDTVKSRMDISVYFKDTASRDAIADLQQKLVARSDVKQVKYISKEDALVIFKAQQGDKKVVEYIDPNENPLPRSLEIKSTAAENLDKIATYINQEEFKPLIHNVSYKENKQIIERMIALTSFVKEIGWVFSILFVVMSILVILNTIRLAIFTRKDEIEIMRLVGASDNFVKVPFVVEGFLYGFLATIFATLLMRFGVEIIASRIQFYLGWSFSHQATDFFLNNIWPIIGLELLVGVSIGVICSLIGVKKYLRF